MERKVLACAVAAGMLAIPASHSAIDDAGMKYTSAGEGFYGSLRMKLVSSDPDGGDDSTDVTAQASRLGVRGSVDLGGGLSANYRYEFGVNPDDNRTGAAPGLPMGGTRLHNVGLSGGFGSLSFGTQWALDYNYVWGTTDVQNTNSGWYAYNEFRGGRESNELAYYSPSFNGFDFGLGVVIDTNPDTVAGGEESTVDEFKVGAKYSVGGFTIAGTYVAGSYSYTTLKSGDRYTVPFAGLPALPGGAEVEVGGVTYTQDPQAAVAASTVTFEVGDPDVSTRNNAPDMPAARHVLGTGRQAVTLDADDAGKAYGRSVLDKANSRGQDFPPSGGNALADIPADGTMDTEVSDPKSLGVAVSYGQDNWSVGYYYADTDRGAADKDGDRGWTGTEKVHSIAGQFHIDKTTLRALYETKDNKLEGSSEETDQKFWSLGVQYDLGSKSRIWAEYSVDQGTGGDETASWEIGHRVDF